MLPSSNSPQTVITMQSHPTSQRVAVIGAGSAGLVASRELHRAGHQVTVFEQNPSSAGGIWVYNPSTESDPLSLNPSRSVIHTSLYKSLRTNLPREVMGFRDYPFISKDPHRDSRRFPGHEEVRLYLEDFMREFGIGELIRFGSEVVRVECVEEKKWVVRFRKYGGDVRDEVYNAVVVCNGHYTLPRIAEIPVKVRGSAEFITLERYFM